MCNLETYTVDVTDFDDYSTSSYTSVDVDSSFVRTINVTDLDIPLVAGVSGLSIDISSNSSYDCPEGLMLHYLQY